MEKMDFTQMQWLNKPEDFAITPGTLSLTTVPCTDLWQRTYYGFRRTDGHMLLAETDNPFFSFTIRAGMDGSALYDQCGIVVYADKNNWFKGSLECENDEYTNLGSVHTVAGYSDFATQPVGTDVKSMFYRLSRRNNDFRLEYSADGQKYQPMRVFHHKAAGKVRFGVYACSPTEGCSFTARFSHPAIGECAWEDPA